MRIAFARGVERLRSLPIAKSTWIVLALVAGFGCLPVFARPGYETALLFGLLLPPIGAVSSALRVEAGTGFEPQLLDGIRRSSVHGLLLALVSSLHAVRAGWCAPGHDLLLLFLGPIIGCVLGACVGSYAGYAASRLERAGRRRGLRVLFGWAGPGLGIVVGLFRFYGSPSVFAFDQFVGFFAGSPYDTGFDPVPRLLSYRLGTAGLILFLWVLARLLDGGRARSAPEDVVARGRSRLWQLARSVDRPLAVLGLLGLVCFGAVTSLGETLGHSSSARHIRETLTQTSTVGRCEVVASAREKHVAVVRLAKDCDAWLTRLERRLGTAPLDRVTAYVFESAAQKELLMGAAHTQIAKPWRHEIYLNGANYPDDVVGHELAHVVGGQVARGPFKIAGKLGGWLPDPGLIEGLAVALAPDEDGDLTALEWSAALSSIGKLPELSQLFSLGFLRHSGPLAYTVAGAFVEWIGDNYGKVAVRRWYRGDTLAVATGQPLAELEKAFRARLAATPLPPYAREAALAKFARLGVYARACPHAVDRCLAEADQNLASGDADAACRLYEEARKLDASELRARFGLGECALRETAHPSHERRAESIFRELADDAALPMPVRQRAQERLADLLLARGEREQARSLYDALAAKTFDVDRRRSVDVKRRAATDVEIQAIKALFFGTDGEVAWDVAVRELWRWSTESPNDGTADYLLGRNYWSKGREKIAVEELDRALERGLPTPELRAEALRQRAIMACALGESELAKNLASRLAQEPYLPTPRRLGILRLVERCTGQRAGDDWPEQGGTATPPPQMPTPATVAPVAPPLSSGAAGGGAASALPYDSDAFACPPDMQKIRGSTFHLGSSRSNGDPDAYPRFLTRIRGFCLDRTEVTVEAYERCVASGACRPALGRSASCNARHPDRKDHPINCVDHAQASAYCSTRAARLPTEAEWEYAARGGESDRRYPWGSESPDGRTCWKAQSSCKVASFAAGAFGLFDMSGNVWEWTASDFGAYPWSTPLAGDVPLKVYRGGGWSRRFEKWMQLGLRNRAEPRDAGAHLGFRCALSPQHLACPFGADAGGSCRFGVVDAECRTGELWNGQRCAKPDAPPCPTGDHVEDGRGCVRDVPMVIRAHAPDLAAVRRRRSPEFDSDCQRNQPKRPNAYQYSGSSHEARNLAASRAGCKNRDVGAGWNSTCCP